MNPLPFQPVIIIGAARSGTNMLRDALTQLPGFSTWPCDEINYVWRHYHARFATDELRPDQATPSVCRYMRSSFAKLARRSHAHWVVEKTCANSLRVDFVRKVLPETKFIFLVRDGRDVVASALQRWRAKLDIQYTLRKARFVPLSDVPYYAWRFARHRAHRLVSREKRVASWGPRFTGMDALLDGYSLTDVCAEQWRTCVESAAGALGKVSTDRCCRIRYEEFVREPAREFNRICDFLGAVAKADEVSALLSRVSDTSVGKWRTQLDPCEQKIVMTRLRPTLQNWGYATHGENRSLSA